MKLMNYIFLSSMVVTSGTLFLACGGDDIYVQRDRLARPIVNEALATVAGDRHKKNNEVGPADDKNELKNDLQLFLRGSKCSGTGASATGGTPICRSPAIVDVIISVLVPDMMIADLSQSGKAAYLGAETSGATGGKFGGRDLSDDVVDTSLSVVFGKTISALNLAADDTFELKSLLSDGVAPAAAGATFPYVPERR